LWLRTELKAKLGRLERLAQVLVVDAATAIRRELKEAGFPIPENDLWIAALTRQHALPLLSDDAHFDRVAGIQRVSW
jgi:tRNA(fMet)-specific endonuclease VapC